jgi:hypothetical protein
MEVSPVSPCRYSCTPLQSLESLKSLGVDLLVVPPFYTHGSVDDGYVHFGILFTTLLLCRA